MSGSSHAGRALLTPEMRALRSKRVLRIEILDLAGGQKEDFLGDVGHPVADPFQVFCGEKQVSACLDPIWLDAHPFQGSLEVGVIQPVDLVVLRGHLASGLGVEVYQREEYAVEDGAGQLAHVIQSRTADTSDAAQLGDLLRYSGCVVADALE